MKKPIRLTEQDLHKIVKESIRKILKETISQPLPQKLYHATPYCYINSIKKYGLGGKNAKKKDYGIIMKHNIKI